MQGLLNANSEILRLKAGTEDAEEEAPFSSRSCRLPTFVAINAAKICFFRGSVWLRSIQSFIVFFIFCTWDRLESL